jgi:cytochrome P450
MIVDCHAHALPAEAMQALVQVNYGAANRDPSTFEDPDDFRIDRVQKGHLAFGKGIHSCVGASLARAELRIAMVELLRQLPDVRLTDTAPPAYELCGNLLVLPALPAALA